MRRPNAENTIANSISACRDALPLRVLGFTGSEPYKFLSDRPRVEYGRLIWLLEYEYKPIECPRDCTVVGCPFRNQPSRHSSRSVEFAHLPEDKPRWVRIELPRWFTNCGIELVPPLPLPGMVEGHRLTVPAKSYLIAELKAEVPIRKLVQRMALSESTIYRFRDQYIPPELIGLCIDPTMKSLGIDEIKIGGKWYTVRVDNTHHRFIGLVRGKGEDDVKAALVEIRQKCKIKRATMDFSRGYISIVRRYFPKIKITSDKFHFVREMRKKISPFLTAAANELAQHEIERIWTALKISPDQQLNDDEADEIEEMAEKVSSGRLLRRDRKFFMRKFKALNQDQRGALKAWFDTIPQREVLTGATRLEALKRARAEAPVEKSTDFSYFARTVDKLPEPTSIELLRELHRLLQRLYSVMNQKTLAARGPEASLNRLHKILYLFVGATYGHAPEIRSFLRDHFEVIAAYFDTGETNAFSESFNRVVRQILRSSRRLSIEALVRKLAAWNHKPRKKRSFEPKSSTERKSKPLQCPSRHGLHRRRAWPFERLESGGEQQMRLPF